MKGVDEDVEAYMSQHRHDTDIQELKTYFTSVIDWISGVFSDVESEMRGIEWGRLFETYHNQPYDPVEVSDKLHELYADGAVKKRAGIFEYILGGCKEPRLLEIRIFEESTKKAVYSVLLLLGQPTMIYSEYFVEDRMSGDR